MDSIETPINFACQYALANNFQEVLNPVFIKRIPLWKRCIDILGSLIGLVLLSPLLLATGLFIKTVSPGPILFKQKRVGCGGELFNLLKFRTMKPDADQMVHKQHLEKLIDSSKEIDKPGNPMQKLIKDPRIIKYGEFLRASGMDELPQLFNVLMGQMSLVGPRPTIPYEAEKYRAWYRCRYDVVPGLTGLWQVGGKNRLGYNEMIRLDIQYVMKRSFLLDLVILFKTPYTILLLVKELMLDKRADNRSDLSTDNNNKSTIEGELC